MAIVRIALVITAAACLSLGGVCAAELEDRAGATPKHHGAGHKPTTEDRASKTSKERSSKASRARSHTNRRTSKSTNRDRNHSRSTGNRDTARPADNEPPPDANVQVELPRRETENENANEVDDDDQSGILLGTGTENEGVPPRE